MSNESELVRPGDGGVFLEPGDEVSVPAEETKGGREVFSVDASDIAPGMLKMSQQIESDNVIRAEAYFRPDKKFTFDMIPDHIRGDEGRKFLRVASAVAAIAAAGAGTYLIIRKKSKDKFEK